MRRALREVDRLTAHSAEQQQQRGWWSGQPPPWQISIPHDRNSSNREKEDKQKRRVNGLCLDAVVIKRKENQMTGKVGRKKKQNKQYLGKNGRKRK
jgi:hypothetical protein